MAYVTVNAAQWLPLTGEQHNTIRRHGGRYQAGVIGSGGANP